MTQTRINEIDAHEAYWRSLTEDAITREQRRAGINATARRIPEPAPISMPPLPPREPWYENVVALLGGAFGAAVAITAIIFAAAVMW